MEHAEESLTERCRLAVHNRRRKNQVEKIISNYAIFRCNITLELYEYMKAPAYTAGEPYVHISNLFFVYDSGGNKVGEFHTGNGSVDGAVSSISM